MRTQFLRATSLRLIIGLVASGALVQAWAEDGPHARNSASPLDQASLAEVNIALPEVPVAAVVVLDKAGDVTGSITQARQPGSDPKAGVTAGIGMPLALQPALSFDEQATQPPPKAAPAPGTKLAVAPADATAPPLVAGPPAAVPPLDAQTGVAPPLAAQPLAVETPAAQAALPQGLSSLALDAALPAFAADRPEGETRAQSEERHKLRESIVAFYAAHSGAPLWIAGDQLTPAARTVLDRLDHAAEDGLDLRRFAVPVPRSQDTDALARAELALSEAAVAYARQASGSRVDVAKIGGIIDFRPTVADVERVLGSVPGALDAGDRLRAFNPSHPGYLALREKLAELRRRNAPEAQNAIPSGPVLKPGMSDARVPLIRARFGLDVAASDATAPLMVYDTKVAAAVADFQRANGLPASGRLTPRTIAMLSGGNPARLENTIVANMEAWRWLPRDLGPDHIEVNIPDYAVRVLHDGAVTHEARVVVGQPDKPTPVFSEVMRFVIVNPYWNVPLSIIKKEMLPKLAADPDYFSNHGYETVERNGITFVRQPPGDDNALGRIKFMFPNAHSVYLHDTNARSFFSRDRRALSHGCVRVDRPFAFAEAVLGRDNGWTEARVKKLIGGNERTINLPKPLPIHIVYFTAFVDPGRGLQLRDDVYGYTGKIKLALGLPD